MDKEKLLKRITKYYPRLWNNSRIAQLLAAGKITAEEYTQITGQAVEAGKEEEEV